MDRLTFFLDCFQSTLSQLVDYILPQFALCVGLRAVCLCRPPPTLRHIASTVFGLITLWLFFERHSAYFVATAAIGYAITLAVRANARGVLLSLATVLYILACDLYLLDPKSWHQIRGSMMVVAMKVISIGFDVDEKRISASILPWEYFGFVFCPANTVFGPFVQYHTYCEILLDRPLSFAWFYRVVRSIVVGLFAFAISVCVMPWLFPEDSNRWLIAYATASSFRFSHHFTCYLSEATSVVAGIGHGTGNWDGMTVSRIEKVELPRSLVEVVTNWNLAMHLFLKTYVYKPARCLGIFPAILLTYLSSSLLHGLNFQLSAVLLSIGVYAYIENVFRTRLARRLNACVLARRARTPNEFKYQEHEPWVVVVNLLFSALAVFHLIYLGSMFDADQLELQEVGYSMEHTIMRWGELKFASHWVAGGMLILSRFI